MSTALEKLTHHFATISDIQAANALLGWDENVYMPPGAASARGQQKATLTLIAKERTTDKQVGKWLDELEDSDPAEGSVPAATLRELRRRFEHGTKIPSEFIEELVKHQSHAYGAWTQARQDNDFKSFTSVLEKTFDLARQQAEYLGYDEHPYDALHDIYEIGSTAAQIKRVFEPLREETVKLVTAIRDSQQVSDAPVRQNFDEAKQEAFAVDIIKNFGYDFQHGRLDRTVHPFAQSSSKYDVRITTRYDENMLNPALFGTFHEAGHGMYEQGIADKYYRTPLANAISLGIHESQSRLWENLVGRSRAFWEGAYERLQATFPEQLSGVELDAFYAAVNKVEPSLIRVEADEVTYNLHVMIRFELELALLENSLKVSELPEAWNALYKDYLGVTVPNDAGGCLQDVHWSVGLVGYFPTYTLGNLMSVQLFEAARRDHPEIENDMRGGNFDKLFDWLRENVHSHGSRYLPGELLKNATGEALSADAYLKYLKTKFSALYGLEG